MSVSRQETNTFFVPATEQVILFSCLVFEDLFDWIHRNQDEKLN